MCESRQNSQFNSLPKVELHLHLDCSLSYEAVSLLAPRISREEYRRDFIAPPKCANLADYLSRAPRGFSLMQSEYALRVAVFDLFRQLREDNVVYAEIRFAPLLHLQAGMTPEEVVSTVEEATREATRATGIEARLILCALRHFTAEQSLSTAKLAKKFEGTLVAAIDLAADEAGYPISAHVEAFRYAIEYGIPRTAHAGEARGAESVWETLRELKPLRIGHGVRSIEDPALMEHLRANGIHLEVCPTSNIQTNVVESYRDHPVERLYRSGISIGINTDTRTITRITLTQEYESLEKVFGWKPEDFLKCNLQAIHAAFAPDPVKERIEKVLRTRTL